MLFAAPTLGKAMAFIGNMFGINGNGFVDRTGLYYLSGNLVLLLICIICARPGLWKNYRKYALRKGVVPRVAATIGYALILIISVAYLVNATYNPFLYFRF